MVLLSLQSSLHIIQTGYQPPFISDAALMGITGWNEVRTLQKSKFFYWIKSRLYYNILAELTIDSQLMTTYHLLGGSTIFGRNLTFINVSSQIDTNHFISGAVLMGTNGGNEARTLEKSEFSPN